MELRHSLEQIPNYGDSRQLERCVYCGAGTETRDHVPSRVFLDRPYPSNLPVVPACEDCNAGFSLDEEYLASLIDCVIAGTSDPNFVPRPKVKRTLERKPLLAKRLENARLEEASSFTIERGRVENVVLKLARGHAAHELNEPQFDYPSQISFLPLATLPHDKTHHFETPPIVSICQRSAAARSSWWQKTTLELHTAGSKPNRDAIAT